MRFSSHATVMILTVAISVTFLYFRSIYYIKKKRKQPRKILRKNATALRSKSLVFDSALKGQTFVVFFLVKRGAFIQAADRGLTE